MAISSKHRALPWSRDTSAPSAMTATERVLTAASAIEPDEVRRLVWFSEDPIRQFGGRTAAQMVQGGEASRLIAMINGIRAMERWG
jgi:hypothetical protein